MSTITVVLKHNLVTQTTPFIGRDDAVNEVIRLIDEVGARLVTLLGPGGIGKSRLALQVAHTLVRTYDVYTVPLLEVTAPEAIIPTIAEAVGFVPATNGTEPTPAILPQDQFMRFIRNRKMLLVLDNFEHLLDGAPVISQLLEAAPRLHIIITSIERLNLSSETVFKVGGMAFPPDDLIPDGLEYGAVQLFIDSARRALPEFDPDGDDLRYINRICRLVQGMPLAILLAAAWADVLTPAEIADEVARGLDFLETEMRDVPDRHRSVRAIFDAAWDRLTADFQAQFMRLAVFYDGFTRQAAADLAGVGLRTLTTLVNKSLLLRDPDSGRYAVHHLLRKYVWTKLRESGDLEAALEAHCHYYADFVAGHGADLLTDRQRPALDEMAADFGNIRAAWKMAAKNGYHESLRCMVAPLDMFCFLQFRHQDSQELFQLAREYAQKTLDQDDLLYGMLLARPLMGKLPTRSEAMDRLTQALAIARQHGDRHEEALCLWQMAAALGGSMTDVGPAQRRLNESLAIFRELDAAYWEALTLYLAANLHLKANAYDAGVEVARQSLERFREIGDYVGPLMALTLLATHRYARGEIENAINCFREGYNLLADVHPVYAAMGRARVLTYLMMLRGDFAGASAVLQDAVTYSDLVGSSGRASLLIAVGWLSLIADGDGDRAEGLFQDALHLSPAEKNDITLVHMGLAVLAAARDREETVLHLQTALEQGGRGKPPIQVLTIALVGLAAAQIGDGELGARLLGFVYASDLCPSGWLENWALCTQVRADLAQTYGEALDALWQSGAGLNIEGAFQQIYDHYQFGHVQDEIGQAERLPRILAANIALDDPLTDRELEVLALICAGHSNREIADRLVVGISTVKKHINNLYSKLTVSSRAQAIVKAQEFDLV